MRKETNQTQTSTSGRSCALETPAPKRFTGNRPTSITIYVPEPLLSRHSQVRLPAAALVSAESDYASSAFPLILLPDLGTAPVASYRALPRGLIALRHTASLHQQAEPLLIVATIDPSGSG